MSGRTRTPTPFQSPNSRQWEEQFYNPQSALTTGVARGLQTTCSHNPRLISGMAPICTEQQSATNANWS